MGDTATYNPTHMKAQSVSEPGSEYVVKTPIKNFYAAYVVPGTDEIIAAEFDEGFYDPTPYHAGFAGEDLRPGDRVVATKDSRGDYYLSREREA